MHPAYVRTQCGICVYLLPWLFYTPKLRISIETHEFVTICGQKMNLRENFEWNHNGIVKCNDMQNGMTWLIQHFDAIVKCMFKTKTTQNNFAERLVEHLVFLALLVSITR